MGTVKSRYFSDEKLRDLLFDRDRAKIWLEEAEALCAETESEGVRRDVVVCIAQRCKESLEVAQEAVRRRSDEIDAECERTKVAKLTDEIYNQLEARAVARMREKGLIT